MGALGIDIGGSSVKVCLLDGEREATARSSFYVDPTRDALCGAIREAIDQLGELSVSSVGLCLPGKRASNGESIEVSINLPCLNGWAFEDLLTRVLGEVPKGYRVLSDVESAGQDCIHAHKSTGRSAIIAIGTGVGLAVFDEGIPVGIGDRSIGHLGMMDMGRLGEADLIAPDGSLNTLESYIGTRVIQRRFPEVEFSELPEAIGTLSMNEPSIQALVRAIRIVHAIYGPDQIVLMGGVGIAMKPLGVELTRAINDGLTSLARSHWRLLFGDSAYHAARGSARSVS